MLFWSSADAVNTIDPEASPGAAGVDGADLERAAGAGRKRERIDRHFEATRATPQLAGCSWNTRIHRRDRQKAPNSASEALLSDQA
jgi:hypothetical protein